MTLRELRYLVALADHRHFGRAANACHVTQSTLSTQIRKLESYLGQTLIDRQSKRLRLTPVGEQIINHARRLVGEADAILSQTRARSGPLEGTLTLGIIPTLAPYYLPHLLLQVNRHFPKLQLIVQEGLTGDLCQRLDDQSLDAALLALPSPLAALSRSENCIQCEQIVQTPPYPLPPDAYQQQVLFDEPFWIALPPGHPLANQPDVDAGALDDLKLLLLTDGHCLRGQALEVCRNSASHNDDAADCRATSLETLQHLVAAGHGCTLLPAMAAQLADSTRLSVRPLRGGEHRRIGLVWPQLHPRGQELELLAETLRQHAPEATRPWPAAMLDQADPDLIPATRLP